MPECLGPKSKTKIKTMYHPGWPPPPYSPLLSPFKYAKCIWMGRRGGGRISRFKSTIFIVKGGGGRE
jgi:hypothetical protein